MQYLTTWQVFIIYQLKLNDNMEKAEENRLIELKEFQYKKLVEKIQQINNLKQEAVRIQEEATNLVRFMLEAKDIDSSKYTFELMPNSKQLKLIELKDNKE